MSVWNEVLQLLEQRVVPASVSPAEAELVREARTSVLRQQIDEGRSAWRVLSEATETAAVKGLTPHEAELVKQHRAAKGSSAKAGNTGMVMSLPPKSWLQIKQELESNPEYYQMLGGGVADPAALAQKIGSTLDLTMGKKPASAALPPPQGLSHGLALGGKESQMTPAVHGAEQFRMDDPTSSKQAEDPAARRKRVAAQDMAMMGAKSSKDLGRMAKSSKVQVQDDYDRMEEDLTAEGIGKWARSAMAAGALGMAGGAMGADQPAQGHEPQISMQGVRPELPGPRAGVRPGGVSKPSKLSRSIDYQQGFRPEHGDYDTKDSMGGLQPEKKPWSNENAECPDEEMVEAEDGSQHGVLSKKTGRPGSISLTQDEFDAVMAGEYESVQVSSTSGKPIKSIPAAKLAQVIQRGGAFLRQVDDDPSKPSFWVVKI